MFILLVYLLTGWLSWLLNYFHCSFAPPFFFPTFLLAWLPVWLTDWLTGRLPRSALFYRDSFIIMFPTLLKRTDLPLRKKSPYSELLWSVFSRIRTEYWCISPYTIRMRENSDQNNSKCWHFSRSVHYAISQASQHHLSIHINWIPKNEDHHWVS